jgi:hypothetical protein
MNFGVRNSNLMKLSRFDIGKAGSRVREARNKLARDTLSITTIVLWYMPKIRWPKKSINQ